jgi:hypothetical protein
MVGVFDRHPLSDLLVAAATHPGARHPEVLMKRLGLLLLFVVTAWSLPRATTADGGVRAINGRRTTVREDFVRQPLRFERNDGQTDPQVSFLSRGHGYALFLTPAEVVLSLRGSTDVPPDGTLWRGHRTRGRSAERERAVLHIAFVGSGKEPEVVGLDELPGRSHYFVGRDPQRWRIGVPHYGRVVYRDLWEGVDLSVYGTDGGQLESDFTVFPGADPNIIGLRFEGARKVRLDEGGNLVVETGAGDVIQHRPLVYQRVGGERTGVDGSWVLRNDEQAGFRVAHYDRSRPLVIDPVLAYSTYLGGSGDDSGNSMTVDAAGNAYVTGYTGSIDFPTAGTPSQGTSGGGLSDAFVTKLSPTSGLLYSTYLGGSGEEAGLGIDVDTAGNAYVTGHTDSTDFPMAGTPSQPVKAASRDAFVVKLSPTSALVYSTYLGGSGWDYGYAVAVDTAGNAHVAGQTDSTDFPTAGTPSQPTYGGLGDAFVTKLGPTSSLVYSTYLGGSGFDWGRDIAVDATGNAYVVGGTQATDFPTAGTPLQAASGGDDDAFIAKLGPTSSLVYSTYLGGSGAVEGADAVAVDAAGDVHVTGVTNSTNFPTAGPPSQASLAGGWDAFVAKVSLATGLVYSTYLGGSGNDRGWGIALDASGSAHVTGETGSTDFPTAGVSVQPASGGGFADAFVAALAQTSGLTYSTYLGGADYDWGTDVAVGEAGDVYVTGGAASTDFPTAGTPSQPASAGAGDAFVARFRWASDFFTVTPCRVADTRNPAGPSGGPALGADTTRSFPVIGVCGIPSTATAVAINVTVVNQTNPGHLRLYPAGGIVPGSSTINFVPGRTQANNAVIPLGTGGQIAVFCRVASPTGHTDFLFDVFGYFE